MIGGTVSGRASFHSDRVYALAGGRVVLEAETGAPDLSRQIEQAYFGHAGH